MAMDSTTVLNLIGETCAKTPDRIFSTCLLMDTVSEKYGEGKPVWEWPDEKKSEFEQSFASCGSETGDESERIVYYISQSMACFFAMLVNPDLAEEKLPELKSNFAKFEECFLENTIPG